MTPSKSGCPRKSATYSADHFFKTGKTATYSANQTGQQASHLYKGPPPISEIHASDVPQPSTSIDETGASGLTLNE